MPPGNASTFQRTRATVLLESAVYCSNALPRQRNRDVCTEWDTMRSLKFAFRTLLKTPFVTAVAVLSLALGIGANAAIFSLFNQILLSPLRGARTAGAGEPRQSGSEARIAVVQSGWRLRCRVQLPDVSRSGKGAGRIRRDRRASPVQRERRVSGSDCERRRRARVRFILFAARTEPAARPAARARR